MSATVQRLIVVALAIAALVATIWTPDNIDTILVGVATGLLGWVGLKRPGDVPPPPGAPTGLHLMCLCFLASLLGGCAAAKPACLIIHAADAACTTLVLADGSEVALTKADVATPDTLGRALARRGVVGCK